MLKNKNEILIEILLIISLFLSFLDAYQLFNIPLNWIGGSLTILIFVILYFYENMKLPSLIKLGVVIALAMILNLFVAGLAGTLIPITLNKFKIDPALASGVILTTITDVFGFLSFLGLASILII